MATTKLTLSIDAQVIERAKIIAKEKRLSLSKLVQEYLLQLSAKKSNAANPRIHPDILALTGILKGVVPDDVDLKEEKYQYLKKKYGL